MVIKHQYISTRESGNWQNILRAVKVRLHNIARVNTVASFVLERSAHSCEMHPSHISLVKTLVVKLVEQDMPFVPFFPFLFFTENIELIRAVEKEAVHKTRIPEFPIFFSVTDCDAWNTVV